jgi:hypothetical protein
MRTLEVIRTRKNPLTTLALVFSLASALAIGATAQDQGQYSPPPPPPTNAAAPPEQSAPPPAATLNPKQLDQLVARIALYPDPLLAQILLASTFPDQIQDAASWANDHSSLKGDELANAIRDDNLQWDPSVIALLPFPSVLDIMAQDMSWTQQLGNVVLSQRPDVMDAVQRQRHAAYQYGYLRTNPYDTVVDSGGYVQILPVNPAYLYVPAYDPLRPGSCHRRRFCPMGLGAPIFWLGRTCLVFRQRTLGPRLGKSRLLRPSLRARVARRPRTARRTPRFPRRASPLI